MCCIRFPQKPQWKREIDAPSFLLGTSGPWVIHLPRRILFCFSEIRKCNHYTIRASFKNFPLIISMLISLDGSSPSLPGGGKQLTRVMGAPWPRLFLQPIVLG